MSRDGACRERFELSIASDGEAENGDAHVSPFSTLPFTLFLTLLLTSACTHNHKEQLKAWQHTSNANCRAAVTSASHAPHLRKNGDDILTFQLRMA